jgi:TusE/DsrC/DsvC family sulfur relay protein
MIQTAEQHLDIAFDENGLLTEPRVWNEDLAKLLAAQVGIGRLTDAHWKIIQSLRSYYAEFSVAPAMLQICKDLNMSKYCVHDLFHTCLNAWIVAGLPNPGEEAKSYLSDM